mgnify:CR=1 FL=1
MGQLDVCFINDNNTFHEFSLVIFSDLSLLISLSDLVLCCPRLLTKNHELFSILSRLFCLNILHQNDRINENN